MFRVYSVIHSEQKFTYDTHKTTPYTALYIDNIIAKINAYISATYKISEHLIGVIVTVIRAVYRLPAKCVGYMVLVWAERVIILIHYL